MQKNNINKHDAYFVTVMNALNYGGEMHVSNNFYPDGTRANTLRIKHVLMSYDRTKGDLPLSTFRTTAIKAAFDDISMIYQKQTTMFKDFPSRIKPWWVDFIVNPDAPEDEWTIGKTYGDTVRRYGLMDRTLHELEHNPNSRRINMDLWQEQQMVEDDKALPPCVFRTDWSVSIVDDVYYVDVILNQRSMDSAMTFSINPFQYTMLAEMVCGHLRYSSGKNYQVRAITHLVGDMHIYDRHIAPMAEVLARGSKGLPTMRLKRDKNFYDYTFKDFEIVIPEGVKGLSEHLEIASTKYAKK